MYFSFSSKATILFEEWDIDSTKGKKPTFSECNL
jgi:hypothetical protein